MSGILNSTSLALLEKGLDAVWLRQQVIANNIANAATPGYKSQKLEFENLLAQQAGTGQDEDKLLSAMESVEPKVVTNNATAAQEDGNNVDLDYENVEMARAQIQYSYMCTSINAQLNRLKYVVTEGRG